MKITDYINTDLIQVSLKAKTKRTVIEELVNPIAKRFNLKSEELVKTLLEREELGSTGIGNEIGIPHGKTGILEVPAIGIGISKNGVNFDSIDGEPVRIFFIILTPEHSEANIHLQVLARISGFLKNESFKEALIKASDSQSIYNVLKNEE